MTTLTRPGCTEKQHALIVRIVDEANAAEPTLTPETAAAVQALFDSITALPDLICTDVVLDSNGDPVRDIDGVPVRVWATVDRRVTSVAIDTLFAAQRLIQASQPRRNAHPGRCHLCGQGVEAQAGLLVGQRGAWKVQHETCPAAPATTPVVVDLPLGLHQHADGRVIKVYVTQNGRKAGKVLVGSSFRYERGATIGLSADTVLTAEQARQYGRTTGHCCNCGDEIGHGDTVSTLISLAQGYGPVCAKRNGWPTLSPDEAVTTLLAEGIDHPLLVQYK